jgi:hypothetical protein
MAYVPATFEARRISGWTVSGEGLLPMRVVKRLCSNGRWAVHDEILSEDPDYIPDPNGVFLANGFNTEDEAKADAEFDRRVARHGITPEGNLAPWTVISRRKARFRARLDAAGIRAYGSAHGLT